MHNLEVGPFEIDKNTPLYTIGIVAEMLDISVHTLRLYENEGLIIPYKKDSKHRLYSQNDIIRLKCIREGIREKKFSIAGIKTLYSMIPCWSIKQCSESDRENCGAYSCHSMPCWTYKHEDNLCELQACSQCRVYKDHARCDSIKTTIIKYTK
jgi:MerR family transcriptional regulator, heat shock protein HspR